MNYNPKDWLITFDDVPTYGKTEGRPFGFASAMAKRSAENKNPWDEGCKAEILIGGLEMMNALREEFSIAIADAKKSGKAIGERGHVYIAGWRFNPNRDISNKTAEDIQNGQTDTAWYWIRQLMDAGIRVRILLWLPITWLGGFGSHQDAHFYTANLMREYNDIFKKNNPSKGDVGVVFLDTRTSEKDPIASSHHQKFIVIRGLNQSVAFCGGVDLAFTRRSGPGLCDGDWQSGGDIPEHSRYIISGIKAPNGKQGSDLIESVYGFNWQIWHDQHLKLQGSIVCTLEEIFRERWQDVSCDHYFIETDRKPQIENGAVISSSANAFLIEKLPKKSYEVINNIALIDNQPGKILIDSIKVWDDADQIISQKTEKDIQPGNYFTALFNPFRIDLTVPAIYLKKKHSKIFVEYNKTIIQPLDVVQGGDTLATMGNSIIQAWQTIPIRLKTRNGLRPRNEIEKSKIVQSYGEFSIMSGLVKACQKAEKLIVIFDQYFWSTFYSHLLREQLINKTNLNIIIILPPHADSSMNEVYILQHALRADALRAFDNTNDKNGNNIWDRIIVAAPWRMEQEISKSRGIYCHAKVQAFDDALLLCGSSNVNDRSHTTDSELSCAILDRDFVQSYYSQIWRHLFGEPIPTINYDSITWGKTFFDAFGQRLSKRKINGEWDLKGNMIVDDWNLVGILPNGVPRDNRGDPTTDWTGIVNPFSLPDKTSIASTLREVVDRIEKMDPYAWRIEK